MCHLASVPPNWLPSWGQTNPTKKQSLPSPNEHHQLVEGFALTNQDNNKKRSVGKKVKWSKKVLEFSNCKHQNEEHSRGYPLLLLPRTELYFISKRGTHSFQRQLGRPWPPSASWLFRLCDCSHPAKPECTNVGFKPAVCIIPSDCRLAAVIPGKRQRVGKRETETQQIKQKETGGEKK